MARSVGPVRARPTLRRCSSARLRLCAVVLQQRAHRNTPPWAATFPARGGVFCVAAVPVVPVVPHIHNLQKRGRARPPSLPCTRRPHLAQRAHHLRGPAPSWPDRPGARCTSGTSSPARDPAPLALACTRSWMTLSCATMRETFMASSGTFRLVRGGNTYAWARAQPEDSESWEAASISRCRIRASDVRRRHDHGIETPRRN